jgi:hypothetical protein
MRGAGGESVADGEERVLVGTGGHWVKARSQSESRAGRIARDSVGVVCLWVARGKRYRARGRALSEYIDQQQTAWREGENVPEGEGRQADNDGDDEKLGER